MADKEAANDKLKETKDRLDLMKADYEAIKNGIRELEDKIDTLTEQLKEINQIRINIKEHMNNLKGAVK
jgi:predicted  nucleic acid-binding Zn-ribbon protein